MTSVIQPDRERFRALARDYTVVPVWRELLADFVTPVSAFARLADDGPGFLLESVDRGERGSRYSFVGRHPLTTLVSRERDIEVRGQVPDGLPIDQGILAAVEWLVGAYRTPPLPELPPLHAGVIGYLGYDVVREVEHLPAPPEDDRGHPDAMVSVIGEVAAFDHWNQQVTLVASAVIPPGAAAAAIDAAYDDAVARVEALARDGARPLDEPLLEPPRRDEPLPEYRSVLGSEAYQTAVAVAKEHIVAGDIFQVVLSQRFDVDLDADPFDVYRVLRQINPSPYMYFVRYPELTLVGASPEPMVQLRDGRVVSRPIAGTRPRGVTDEEDRRLGAELREHPKELAEHVMLLDLARNDVGRRGPVRHRAGRRADDPRALQPRDAPHLTGFRRPGRGPHPGGRPAGHPPRRDGVGGPEGPGHGDHRRPRAHPPGALRRDRRLPRLLREHRHGHHDPHPAGRRRRPGLGPGGRRDRLRQRSGGRGRRVPRQGPGGTGGHPVGSADDRSPASGRRRTVPDSSVAVVVERDVVTVEGPDAAPYLQGQLSQDVDGLAVGGSAWTFVLQPQGKVDAWFRLTRTGDEAFRADIEAGHGEALLARLQRFLLRTKAELALSTEPMVAVRGTATRARVGRARPRPGVAGGGRGGPARHRPGPRRHRDRRPPTVLERLRIEAGVPAMGTELTDRTIPAEAGVVERSVSFTKGCFTGQELVARIDSRGGHVPRHLRRLEAEGPGALPVGGEVVVAGQVVGEVTSSVPAGNGRPAVALAYVRRAVEPPASGAVADTPVRILEATTR